MLIIILLSLQTRLMQYYYSKTYAHSVSFKGLLKSTSSFNQFETSTKVLWNFF